MGEIGVWFKRSHLISRIKRRKKETQGTSQPVDFEMVVNDNLFLIVSLWKLSIYYIKRKKGKNDSAEEKEEQKKHISPLSLFHIYLCWCTFFGERGGDPSGGIFLCFFFSSRCRVVVVVVFLSSRIIGLLVLITGLMVGGRFSASGISITWWGPASSDSRAAAAHSLCLDSLPLAWASSTSSSLGCIHLKINKASLPMQMPIHLCVCSSSAGSYEIPGVRPL